MKPFIHLTAISTLALTLTLSSCGGGGEEAGALKIETKDVKGTIEADGASVGKTELHNNEGVCEAADIEFGDAFSIQIAPTSRSFDELWAEEKNNAESFDGTITEITKEGDAVLYEKKSEFMGKKEQGYGILVVIAGKDKNYYITGEGSDPLKPIAKKEDAEKAFQAAQTFKPE